MIAGLVFLYAEICSNYFLTSIFVSARIKKRKRMSIGKYMN